MELTISGLKCDYCDYRDESVQFSEYQESIDKPCPECGQSLLTEEEYNSCILMYQRVEQFKKVAKVLRWLNPFHYWRLIFGDKRETTTVSGEFPKRFENKCKHEHITTENFYIKCKYCNKLPE